MTCYIIRSKLTGEYYRATYMDRAFWTEHKLLAAKYDSMSGAVIAWSQLGMSPGSVSVEPYDRQTMHNPAPMQTLNVPRRIETPVRRLSPETLAECRRVTGGAL